MDKTFAELKKENKVLWAEYENLKNNLDKVQSKLKENLTVEGLTKIFAPYSITINKTANCPRAYTATMHVPNEYALHGERVFSLISWVVNSNDNIESIHRIYEDDGFNLFSKVHSCEHLSTYKDCVAELQLAKTHTDTIESLLKKFTEDTELKGLMSYDEQIYEIRQRIKENVKAAKEAFILEKYGVSESEVAVGKSYFLYDTKGSYKIGLVEVVSKDSSGIGYTCIDHEADDKKYYHVRPGRLEEDLREFPKLELEYGYEK